MVDVVDRARLPGCDWIATRIESRPSGPTTDERRLQLRRSDCMVVVGRMCSSLARMVRPLMSLTGTTDLLKRPSSQAFAARCWLCTA